MQSPEAPRPSDAEQRAAGNATFAAVVFGSLGGMVVGGLAGVLTGNPGGDALGGLVMAILTVAFASWGVGVTVALAWDWLVGAITRTASGTGRDSTMVVAVGASALAGMAFILVIQPFALPVAVLSISLPTVWLAAVLAWLFIKRKLGGSWAREERHHDQC